MKKILITSALFLTIVSALVGCGADRKNDSSGYNEHDYPATVTDRIRDREDDIEQDASDRIKDAIDGAGDAANDIIDGAENAGDDIVDGVLGTRTDVKTTKTTTKNER